MPAHGARQHIAEAQAYIPMFMNDSCPKVTVKTIRMDHNAIPKVNRLWIARKKAGLGQKNAARLLGHKSVSPLSEYETGRSLPGLCTALRLSIIYGLPLSELYAPLYECLRKEITLRRSDGRHVSLPQQPEYQEL